MRVVETLCKGCGNCISICPLGAMKLEHGVVVIDLKKCDQCEECVFVCPHGAISG
ncbi:MAG: 4Fe-4S binding protein [Peptococcaceae bacterium]|nr:4Fe-4S binding protein [Peptococcaceae bacterium]